jgi:hypothetical protein
VRVIDEAAREAVAQRLAVRGDAVDEVEVGGVDAGVVGGAVHGEAAPDELLVEQRLELAPRAQPQRERVDVGQRSRGELGVGGVMSARSVRSSAGT